MKRSTNLQIVAILLLVTGVRALSRIRLNDQLASHPHLVILMVSAVIVGGASLYAAVALWRNAGGALRRTQVWAVALLADLILRELLTPRDSAQPLIIFAVLGGVALLLWALVRHVQHYASADT